MSRKAKPKKQPPIVTGVSNSSFADERVIGNLFDADVSSTDAQKKPKNSCSAAKLKQPSDLQSLPARSSIADVLSSVTVEPALFFHLFSLKVFGPIFSYMFMRKLCLQQCHFSIAQCDAFGTGTNASVDTTVQKAWAEFDNYSVLISSVPEIVFALFVGSWSDIFGRKPAILMPMFGMALSILTAVLLYFIPTLPIWMLFLPSLMQSLSGGLSSLLTGALSYAADISHGGNSRTIRIAAIDAFQTLGFGAGGLVSGMIVRSGAKSYVNYSVAFAATVIGFIFVAIRIHETRRPEQPHSAYQTVSHFFSPRNLVASCRIMTTARPGRTQRNLWLLLATFFFFMAIFMAEFDMNQKYFMGAPLRWSLSYYVTFDGAMAFVRMACMAVLIVVGKKVFGWRDTTIGIIACLSRIAYSYTLSIATTTWMVYVGTFLGIIKYATAISLRSLISEMVPEDEQGKVFALVAVVNVISPMAGSASVTAIFTATAECWPSFYNLVSAYMALIPLALLVLVDFYMRCDEAECVNASDIVPDVVSGEAASDEDKTDPKCVQPLSMGLVV